LFNKIIADLSENFFKKKIVKIYGFDKLNKAISHKIIINKKNIYIQKNKEGYCLIADTFYPISQVVDDPLKLAFVYSRMNKNKIIKLIINKNFEN
jgi:hypothetical protein